MKEIYLLLLFIFSVFRLSSQTDTVFFNIDPVTAVGGDQQCVTVKTSSFNDIVAVQLGFQWDSTALQFDTLLEQGITRVAYSHIKKDRVLISWDQVVGVSIPDGDGLIDLCFTALTDVTTPISIDIVPLDLDVMEVINGQLEQVVIVTNQEVYIPPVHHNFPCDQDQLCLEEIHINYSGDTIKLWPHDLIQSGLDTFLQCVRSDEQHIYLINLSAENAEPTPFVDLFCGNLRDTISIGIAVRSPESEQYWVLCIVSVIVDGIVDDNCRQQILSVSDPLICKDVNRDVSSTIISLDHTDFLGFTSVPTVEYSYIADDNTWNYNSELGEEELVLDCDDYNVGFKMNTSLIIAPPEGPPGIRQIVIPGFCVHEILLNSSSDVCDDNIDEGEVELKLENLVRGNKANVYLNGNALEQITTNRFKFKKGDIFDKKNAISIDQNRKLIDAEVSTIDMITIIKALWEEESLTSHQVIGADVDRSGSVTTKDVIIIRDLILGLISSFSEGVLYLARPEFDMPNLDYLSFNNDYKEFSFDKKDFNNSIDLEVGLVGDVYVSKSKDTKKKDVVKLIYDDIYLKTGATTSIELQLEKDGFSPIIGILMGIDQNELSVKGATVNGTKTNMKVNDTEVDYRISFIKVNHQDRISIQLEVVSKKDGNLSELLRLSNWKNEAVSGDDTEYHIQLVKNNKLVDELSLTPNPAQSFFIISIPAIFIGGKLVITDVIGRTVLTEEIGGSERTVNIEELSGAGIYIVRVSKADHYKVSRIYFE